MNRSLLLVLTLIILSIGLVSAGNINITYPPQDMNISYTTININYTINNANYILYNYSCWYIFNTNTYAAPCNNTSSSTASLSLTGVQGYNNFTVYANESDSINSSVSQSNLEVYIDSIAPTISITYPTSGSKPNNTITSMNYTYIETYPSSCWFFNGTANNTITCGQNITTKLFSNQGSNTWIMYINDTYNNVASQSITFNLDNIKPVLISLEVFTTYNSARIHWHANESVNTTIHYSDVESNLNYNESESSFDTDDSIFISDLDNATTYFFNITICDRAGNCFANKTQSFITNATNPTLPVINNTVVVKANTSCTTTYTYGEWGDCRSDGTQIRVVVTKSDPNCFNPNAIVQQACSYVDPILYRNEILNATTNSTSSSDYSWSNISTPWKIIIGILIFGAVFGIAFAIYSFMNPSDETTTEYDPMGGYGINDYYPNE
jgi:hypothetical protein